MYYDLINLYNAYQNEKTNREGARVVWTNRKQTFPPPAGFRDLSWDRDYIWSLHKYEICLSYEYLLCDKSILHMTWFLKNVYKLIRFDILCNDNIDIGYMGGE